MNLEKSPVSKLVLGLKQTPQSPRTATQLDPTKEKIRKQKDNYLTHWKELTKQRSKLECYLALNRKYTVAEYLTTVTDPNLRKSFNVQTQ
jgi:3-methyladenine DNA glycosylase AlkD